MSARSFKCGWYVGRVIDAIRASAALRDAGFETFLPKEIRKATFRGKRITRELVAWPGYVFVRIETTDGFGAAREVKLSKGPRALIGFVGPENAPSRVPDFEMAILQEVWNAPQSLYALEVGAAARIVAGPLSGYEGVIERLENGGCRILLDLFGALVSAQIESASIEAINPKNGASNIAAHIDRARRKAGAA